MTFRVLARTLLLLGAELISSDAVALFELVKNGFDAGSKRVRIDVVVRIALEDIRLFLDRLESLRSESLGNPDKFTSLRSDVGAVIDQAAPEAKPFGRIVARAQMLDDLRDALMQANYLLISDTGEGMSLSTLDEVYLTVGTRSRLITRSQRGIDGSERPILGEKGVGRLSTMRLGTRLHVESTTSGEEYWNLLDIDWSWLSHDSDALIEEIPFQSGLGSHKADPAVSGTRLYITGLQSEWTREKLQSLAQQEFSRLTDPFTASSHFPVQLYFNGDVVPVPPFSKLLLEYAHATVHAKFEQSTSTMRLSGTVRYKGKDRPFAYEREHLLSLADVTSPRTLKSLGPFDLDIYWYNRRILEEIEGIGDLKAVKGLVSQWAGGVMVFRDGFRVVPYGGSDDDWLDLDRRALAAGGYKVNRRQLIGRVAISSARNPALSDQTNREGLRDCPEKRTLVALLLHVLLKELKIFLDKVDEEVKAREPVDMAELERRVVAEEHRVRENLDELLRRVPVLREQKPLLNEIRAAVDQIDQTLQQLREMTAEYQAGRDQLLNLAGIGLMVEILAHELNRATEHALQTLATAPGDALPLPLESLLSNLRAQLKTLQKRLKVLDPVATAARQHKETFDIATLAQETIDSHREQFEREHIDCKRVIVEPAGTRLHVRAVRGMIVQVLENLIANSVYWLRQQRILHPTKRAEIRIMIDSVDKELRFSDTGPGIPASLKDRVFEAFYTTKPAGEGKGLGLFIAREIARYHGAELALAEDPDSRDGSFHTFILSFRGMDNDAKPKRI